MRMSAAQFVEKYGDVSSVDLGGGMRCVLLTGQKCFREAFVEQAETFTDRPPYPLNDRLTRGMGNGNVGHKWLHVMGLQ